MIYSENVWVCLAVPLLLTLFFLRDKARQFVLNFLLGMAACLLGAYVSGFVDAASGRCSFTSSCSTRTTII